MRNRDDIYKCLCSCCGSSFDIFYDTYLEEYICSECLDNEEDQGYLEKEEDNYPLDMTYNELAKERNK